MHLYSSVLGVVGSKIKNKNWFLALEVTFQIYFEKRGELIESSRTFTKVSFWEVWNSNYLAGGKVFEILPIPDYLNRC